MSTVPRLVEKTMTTIACKSLGKKLLMLQSKRETHLERHTNLDMLDATQSEKFSFSLSAKKSGTSQKLASNVAVL
jgi:hypothetical protein